jgi:hypothetical protein
MKIETPLLDSCHSVPPASTILVVYDFRDTVYLTSMLLVLEGDVDDLNENCERG